MNMASTIRLSPTQFPEIYKHLPPICERLGIQEPEFYLEMNPTPNAYTAGDTRVFIVVTSSLVEMMDDEELDAILAHECGHCNLDAEITASLLPKMLQSCFSRHCTRDCRNYCTSDFR